MLAFKPVKRVVLDVSSMSCSDKGRTGLHWQETFSSALLDDYLKTF